MRWSGQAGFRGEGGATFQTPLLSTQPEALDVIAYMSPRLWASHRSCGPTPQTNPIAEPFLRLHQVAPVRKAEVRSSAAILSRREDAVVMR